MDIKQLRLKISEYKWETLIFLSVIVLILIAMYNKLTGRIGTWSSSFEPELGIVRSHKRTFSDQNSGSGLSTYTSSFSDANQKNNKNSKESQGERECRRVMQEIYNRPFIKVRPSFLRNDAISGSNLELDCYNADLKIAVEYNGEQHYNFVRFFHRNRDAFHNQKYRDDMKRRLCQSNGILLIEVPYTVKIPDIKQFIVKELVRNGKL